MAVMKLNTELKIHILPQVWGMNRIKQLNYDEGPNTFKWEECKFFFAWVKNEKEYTTNKIFGSYRLKLFKNFHNALNSKVTFYLYLSWFKKKI